MTAPNRIEKRYRIRFDESGPNGSLRSSAFLRYAHDVAWVHSEKAGFDRKWYGERGLTWLIRALELDLVDGVRYGEELDVSTEVLGFRRAWARRRSEFNRQGEERTLAIAAIDWILLNARGALARVPGEILDVFGKDATAAFTPLRIEVDPTPGDAACREFEVRSSDLDPMGHVNNAAYLDYIDEQLALASSSMLHTFPRRYRVEFTASAEPGTSLVGRGWEDDLAWCYRLETADGRELVRARVETDPGTWVGG